MLNADFGVKGIHLCLGWQFPSVWEVGIECLQVNIFCVIEQLDYFVYISGWLIDIFCAIFVNICDTLKGI